jgi:hypothetical protein
MNNVLEFEKAVYVHNVKWELISEEYKWVTIDRNGSIIAHDEVPTVVNNNGWFSLGHELLLTTINFAPIDNFKSCVFKRPIKGNM